MATQAEPTSTPRLLRAKPPPIDLNVISSGAGSTPNRIQFWTAAQQRVAPELGLVGPGSPTPLHEGGLSPGISLSPFLGEASAGGGWAGLPAHILELIFAELRDSQGRWPSRKVLFSVCGVCKLWRRVGHTLFFSNIWHHHSDVIVHPSQLFTLSPQPLRLHTSDHLLRCFVHRTPCKSSGLSPRLGRLWRFALYLGSDHRGLQCQSGLLGRRAGGGGGGSLSGPAFAGGGSHCPASARPQLLMMAQQTGRRTYQLLLSPPTRPCSGRGGAGRGGLTATSIGMHSPRADDGGGADGGGGVNGGEWQVPRPHASGYGYGHMPAAMAIATAMGSHSFDDAGGRSSSRGRGARDSGVVAVLRSNIRCSHYELVPDSSCPWARRLIAVAGYMSPQGGQPQPLIQLEYRLRVRGIMLPRRMKVQVPVPHSLQRVVHNPLYDMHEPMAGGPNPAAAGWHPALGAAGVGGGGGAAAAVMAPPAPAAAAGGVAHPGAPFGGVGGFLGEGQGGLMDNLEDIPEAAMRAEPLLFANMVDAAMVRPADDDEAADGGGGGGAGARAANAAVAAAAVAAAGSRVLRRVGSAGSALLRGFLNRSLAGVDASGGGGVGQPAGGTVQWWGPSSPGSRRGTAAARGADADATAGGGGGDDDGVGGWAPVSPLPARVVQLQNKAPHWNDALMCWCLNFRGRVKLASVKNFQLMCSADKAERCVMQFGKVEQGIYILDFNPCVLTAAQAFAAALSTFETKYLM